MENFNNSKYTKWYYAIVNNRLSNPLPKNVYKEKHHIIPESFYSSRSREGVKGWLSGDPDDKNNLVELTAREHALCHWLLTKMTISIRAYELMIYSFNMMRVSGVHQERKVSRMISRAYEKNRIEWSRIHSKKMTGRTAWNKGKKLDDEKYKGGKKNKGKKHTADTIEKRVNSMINNGNNKRSDETKKKMSDWQKGISKGAQTENHKLAISLGSKGHKKSKEFSEKCADRMKENFSINNPNKNPDLQKTCPYCFNKYGPTNYSRWHGENCKQK
jgi:hypothetical protein